MTKKHFIRLAAVLNKYLINELNSPGQGDFHDLVSDIADFCEEQNENFDRTRFFKAVNKGVRWC